MSLTKFNGETNNIQGLANKPTQSASELKTLFDKTGDDLKTYINNTLTSEIDTALGTKANSSNVYPKSDVYNKTETDTSLATKAPTSHSSSNTTYGVGTVSNYGHCKTINNLTSASFVNGEALSAYQGKLLNDKVNTAQSTANTAQNTANTARTEAQSAQNTANSATTSANAKLPLTGGTLTGNLYSRYINSQGYNINTASGNIYTEGGKIDIAGGTFYGNKVSTDEVSSVNIDCTNIDTAGIKSAEIYEGNTVTNAPNLYITSSGNFRRTTNTSSKRYKKDIKEIEDSELNPERLYELKVKQFKYKKEYQPNEKDSRYDKNLIGFIAEDIAEIYPIAADINENGQVENWNERYLIPAMLDLIQKQNERIKVLEQKL